MKKSETYLNPSAEHILHTPARHSLAAIGVRVVTVLRFSCGSPHTIITNKWPKVRANLW